MKKLDFLKVSFMVRSDKKESGMSPVLMMLFLDGRRAYVSTGLVAELKNWDSKYGRFVGDPSKVNTKNEFLERMKMDVLRIYNEMKSKDDDITVDILRQKLKGEADTKAKSLIECCQVYNSSFEKLVGIEIGEITFGRYATFAARISEFITTKLKLKDIYLTDIKYSFGIEYEHYLKTELKLHQNTLVKYIQYLNRVLDYCVKYEWLEKNVLFGYKCPVKETKREYLTQDELQRIMEKVINIDRLREVRDIFVFCCHTGYAYKDAAELTPDHIGMGINGRKWIYTSRQKTDNVSNVPLLDQAMEIIEKYQNHPICVSKNRLLPMKSNQKLNSYLKELADICGITKPMTMHIARHTFATTVLLSNGVSMEATSKMLGHSSLKTTQIYGKILETRVGAEMEMLSAKLSKSVDAEIKLKEAK
ncbi:MAG TPA: site-specific integrase [Saprospiraceae bacterium]|nr:site-specific integrase [Saprospiraceae bacterium]